MNDKKNKTKNNHQYPDFPSSMKEETGGNPVFTSGVLYAQAPLELLKDKTVSDKAKVLYSIYHNFCNTKELDMGPYTWVGQKRIADWLGCGTKYVSKLTNELKEKGWLTPIRRGLTKTNVIILHDTRGKKLTKYERGEYLQSAKLGHAYKYGTACPTEV